MTTFWTADRNRTELSTRLSPKMANLIANLQTERENLLNHPVYSSIHCTETLHHFMEHHVFAVWDFMSLLKALQRQLSCVTLPWAPTPNQTLRRLVNEIVLAEETDEDGQGGYASHFELYLDAMRECQAQTTSVEKTLEKLVQGESLASALSHGQAPLAAQQFCQSTFAIIQSNNLPAITATFTFSREDVIPIMFQSIVDKLRLSSLGRYQRFIYYLDRHIALDTDAHGPMAFDMIEQVCGESPMKWAEAEQAARLALRNRSRLWDGVLTSIKSKKAAAA